MTQAKVILKKQPLKYTLAKPPDPNKWFKYAAHSTSYLGVVSNDGRLMIRMTEDGSIYVTDTKNFKGENTGNTVLEPVNVEIKEV